MQYSDGTAETTHTINEFIAQKDQDEISFRNFSTFDLINGTEYLIKNVIDDYMDELLSICIDVDLTREQYVRYKYSPDLLAYDIYGSTQLDYLIMQINGVIEPRDFNFKKLKLPYASQLSAFLNSVYNSETTYLQYNRDLMLTNQTVL